MVTLTPSQLAEVTAARANDGWGILEPELPGLSDEQVYAEIVADRECAADVAARDAAEEASAWKASGFSEGARVTITADDDGVVWEAYSAKRWEGGILLQLHATSPWAMFASALHHQVVAV